MLKLINLIIYNMKKTKTYNTPTGYKVLSKSDTQNKLEVRDIDGDKGKIFEIDDDVITIQYNRGGFGEFTLNKKEEHYIPLYILK